jgi:multidrug transporter EmrE-like cation transporter
MMTNEPKVLLGLAYAGWAGLGVLVALAVFLVWERTLGRPPFDLLFAFGPSLAVLAGLAFHSLRAGSVSPASVAAAAATMLGSLLIPPQAFIAPIGIAFGFFLLVASFEKIKGPISGYTLAVALGTSSAVLPAVALFSGGLKGSPNNPLVPAFFLLYLAVVAAWSGRYSVSRRMFRGAGGA